MAYYLVSLVFGGYISSFYYLAYGYLRKNLDGFMPKWQKEEPLIDLSE
jgi:hypothetical protein